MSMQESGEMYLEAIYVLIQKNGNARSVDVSDYLGYSKPSVSRGVGILKKEGYVTVEADGTTGVDGAGSRESAEDLCPAYAAHPCPDGNRRQPGNCGGGCLQAGARRLGRVL